MIIGKTLYIDRFRRTLALHEQNCVSSLRESIRTHTYYMYLVDWASFLFFLFCSLFASPLHIVILFSRRFKLANTYHRMRILIFVIIISFVALSQLHEGTEEGGAEVRE